MIPGYAMVSVAVLMALSAVFGYLLKGIIDDAVERLRAENKGDIQDDDEWEDDE